MPTPSRGSPRAGSSAASLIDKVVTPKDFEELHNFRDFAHFTNGLLKPGAIYRSAGLDLGTEKDVAIVFKEYEIKTVVDLRGSIEWRPKTYLDACVYRTDDPAEGTTQTKPRVIHIPLQRKLTKELLISLAPWYIKLWSFFLILFCMRHESRRAITRHTVAKGGLCNLNRLFLVYGKEELRQVLSICEEEQNHPVLIHCTHGKDRTGLVIAILQVLAGASMEHVMRDYHQSQVEMSDELAESLRKRLQRLGIVPSFVGCDPQVMLDTFSYISREFGGVSQYLERELGISVERQAKLRELLLASRG